MREYHYNQFYLQLLQPDIVVLLTRIHEFKGEQALFIEAKADTLTKVGGDCQDPEYRGFQ